MQANVSMYDGEWLRDTQNGYGKETWVDGSRFEGYYKDGQKHDYGVYVWKKGNQYEG